MGSVDGVAGKISEHHIYVQLSRTHYRDHWVASSNSDEIQEISL